MLETAPLLQKFLGIQPRTFGAVLVILGLLQVAFGVLFLTVRCSYTDDLGIHFFSGSLDFVGQQLPSFTISYASQDCWKLEPVFFLAGVISVIADRIPSIGLIKACLIFCIISATTAVVINFLYLRDILYFLPSSCPFTDKVQHGCRVHAQLVFYCTGLRGLAFAAGTVGICLTIVLAVFGCKTVCYNTSEDTVPVIALQSQNGKRNPE